MTKRTEKVVVARQTEPWYYVRRVYLSFAYSAFAAMRMGMRLCLYADPDNRSLFSRVRRTCIVLDCPRMTSTSLPCPPITKKLVIFDFQTQKWTDWVSEPGVINLPTWLHNGRYIYYANPSEAPGIRRVKVGQTRSELIVEVKDLHALWSGLTPNGATLFLRDVSVDEIYSLDVELP
jgi:hypothetical protein